MINLSEVLERNKSNKKFAEITRQLKRALLNKDLKARESAVRKIEKYFPGKSLRGFRGDNQLFLKLQSDNERKTGELIYFCDIPEIYSSIPTPYSFGIANGKFFV